MTEFRFFYHTKSRIKFNIKSFKPCLVAVLFFLQLFGSKNISAQAENIRKAKFSGLFNFQSKNIPKSLSINISTNYPRWELGSDTIINVNSKGEFYFELDVPQRTSFIIIKTIDSLDDYQLLGTYYVEPGDDLSITVYDKIVNYSMAMKKDSIYFNGRGSAKYNLIERLEKDYYSFFLKNSIKRNFTSTQALDAYLKNLRSEILEYNKRKLSMINDAKDVNILIKNLVEYQFLRYKDAWFFNAYVIYRNLKKSDFELKSKLTQFFNWYSDEFLEYKYQDVDTLSPVHFAAVSQSIKYKLVINSDSGTVDLVDYYNSIKNSYVGNERERFLIEFFMNPKTRSLTSSSNSNVLDSLLTDAKRYLTSDYGKKVFNLKYKFASGSQFFEADFVDKNGASFNTSLLRGKVFLMVLWGTGCTNCAILHKVFEERVWPHVEGNKDFVFVSLGVDKHRSKWINSMSSGKYSSDHYTNVFLGDDKGFDHPFTKYYEIQSSPFLFLVGKDGKIIRMIDPASITTDGDSLLKMIMSGLAKNGYVK